MATMLTCTIGCGGGGDVGGGGGGNGDVVTCQDHTWKTVLIWRWSQFVNRASKYDIHYKTLIMIVTNTIWFL